jgi:flagellar basal-body rod protein FlgB
MDRESLIHLIERKLQNFRKQTKNFGREKRDRHMRMLDNIFGVHENAMQLRQRRLSLLGENIANADTPNYKAKDLDFKALMNNERSMSTRRTHELHIDHAGGSKNGLIYRVPNNPAADGNTVELNFQQAEFGKESARYTATLQFLENRIGGVRRALRGE